ncbi:SDR family oxidoreductase [Paeniglutamicibacter kerguelensis]|uniref:NAD(P)-dependent dehydrogenase (Short-subunit alcohol dehydrogenase family) n=1 Tax=Paeniglutamicibacter kerguelensis TaxID=254788 RepID=A0ABS4XCZ9_9MICC|nr:SDR family oxidoreductase [Paeniglutamicibacter kerguelensis]MBP2386236.1 NAD(P)-dependent dehydrogenase (short-subunit alcohol dehydrogenase family) [Paeniglutamicibacter kerguelensis]
MTDRKPKLMNGKNQLAVDNPVKRHPRISPPKQDQPEPGLDALLEPLADHGEKTYKGTGRLKGRKALITGGDSGIGAAVAIAFAREGADVAIAYLPAEEQDAGRILSLVQEEGRLGVGFPGDLLDENYLNTLVDEAAQALGGLDILVNNAGKQIAVERLEDLDDEQIMKTFQVNVLAMFTLSRAALKHFPDGASIINTTSVQAYDPSPTLLDYASTKAAINALTKGLAVQLAPRGIRVNAVAPGPIWTPLQVSDGQPKDALPKFGHNVPLGRAGQPVELAPAYVFLASAESSYVLGETLNVNGGKHTP